MTMSIKVKSAKRMSEAAKIRKPTSKCSLSFWKMDDNLEEISITCVQLWMYRFEPTSWSHFLKDGEILL